MVAEGGEGVEGGAGPEDPEAPGAPPGGDEEDEGELNEFGGGDAEGDAEDFGDEALDEMEFDLRAVELHVAERGEGVGGGGGAENEQGGPVGEEEYLRAEAEDAEIGAAGENVHGLLLLSFNGERALSGRRHGLGTEIVPRPWHPSWGTSSTFSAMGGRWWRWRGPRVVWVRRGWGLRS